MKLYYSETPNPRLACAVARHLDLTIEYVRVDTIKGEHKHSDYLAINPNGKVPTLVDGDLTLWEAPIICCHLAARSGSDLWPTDEKNRIDVLRWIHWNTAHFSRHAGRIFFERIIKPAIGIGDPDVGEINDATGYFKQFAAVLDGQLKGRACLVGNRLTVADFSVGTFLPMAQQAALPLEGFDEIRRWYGQLEALPAWRDPFPLGAASGGYETRRES